MELEWLGRYRRITASLVYYANVMNRRIVLSNLEIGEGIRLNAQEWQTLECIIEHEGENLIMADISSLLAIPQSTLTVIAKKLYSWQLIEKYRREGNRKNIILQPTEKGRKLYVSFVDSAVQAMFEPFFEALQSMSDQELDQTAEALDRLSRSVKKDDSHTHKLILIKE